MRFPERRSLLVLALLFTLPLLANQDAQPLAVKAATDWLALLDTGNYAQSWETASETLKSATTKQKWQGSVSNMRGQTGKCKSRAYNRATYLEDPPNSPPGKYFVIQFNSSFDAGPLVETAIIVLGKDGLWRVAGYFVKSD